MRTIYPLRIETGDQNPNYRTVKALLERLGLPEDRYYTYMSPEVMATEDIREQAHAQCVRF